MTELHIGKYAVYGNCLIFKFSNEQIFSNVFHDLPQYFQNFMSNFFSPRNLRLGMFFGNFSPDVLVK